jgi:hypothetical protein
MNNRIIEDVRFAYASAYGLPKESKRICYVLVDFSLEECHSSSIVLYNFMLLL